MRRPTHSLSLSRIRGPIDWARTVKSRSLLSSVRGEMAPTVERYRNESELGNEQSKESRERKRKRGRILLLSLCLDVCVCVGIVESVEVENRNRTKRGENETTPPS